jgi:hypothetical protein
VDYRDRRGYTVAKVHQYVDPDGNILASGMPDPKFLFHNGLGIKYCGLTRLFGTAFICHPLPQTSRRAGKISTMPIRRASIGGVWGCADYLCLLPTRLPVAADAIADEKRSGHASASRAVNHGPSRV